MAAETVMPKPSDQPTGAGILTRHHFVADLESSAIADATPPREIASISAPDISIALGVWPHVRGA